jgi:aspartate racemase
VVHQVIFDELCVGTIRDASRQAYRAIIQKLVAQGAQGVILGCTEIELLISQADSSVPVFPTTRLHITAAVDLALDDQRDDQQYRQASSGLCPPNVVSSAPELVSSRP